MKPKRKLSKLGILLLAITVICAAAVVFIVVHMTRPVMGTKGKELLFRSWGKEVLLENVYITSCMDGKVSFIYQMKEYEMKGKVSEEYSGVADLQIKWNKIVKITAKPDSVEGTLQSYTDEQMTIQEYGTLDCVPELYVYSNLEEHPQQITLSDLVLGASNLKYVVADRTICALILEEEVPIYDVRVLLKNGDSICWQELWLSGDAGLTVGGTAFEPDLMVNAKKYMDDNGIGQMDVSCEGGQIYIRGEDESINGYGYTGVFHLTREQDGIVIVNELPIEDYVRCVLPSEMPGSFGKEALKAQAVCARTFAYDQMRGGSYAKYGANMDNTTAYQVYHAAEPTDSTNQAVEETAGEVLLQDGNLITCYYFSTSSGATETLEVWDTESPEYLETVMAFAENTDSLSLETVFMEFISSAPESADSASPYYRWDAVLDIIGKQDTDYGKIQELQVKERSKAGYVLQLDIICKNGTKTLEKENEIRNYLGKYLQELTLQDGTVREGFTTLPSACFRIAGVTDDEIKLRGGGFGHGIGMSQYGADSLAGQGYTYDEILNYYYHNVTLMTIDNWKG